MNISLLSNKTIRALHTFACEPVHPAWVNELTTPFATSIAILELSDGELVSVAPCEIDLDPGQYPSLGLVLEQCDRTALRWDTKSGETLFAQPLAAASTLLPFTSLRVETSDPLREGNVSEIRLIGQQQEQLVFRHIMPPMTLGIACVGADQAPDTLVKPMPLRGAV